MTRTSEGGGGGRGRGEEGEERGDEWVEVQRRKVPKGEGKQASNPPARPPPPQQLDTEELDFEFDDQQLGGKKHNFSEMLWYFNQCHT